jgi:formate/nitrite transporter FocA (FNT family)
LSKKNDQELRAKRFAARSEIASKTLYSIIAETGKEELLRPSSSLLYSALTAGLAMGASVLLMGAIERAVGDADWNYLAIAVGYPAGFLLIAMARMQLFTENTLTAVLPVTKHRRWRSVRLLMRLWAIVLFGNLVGAVLIGSVLSHVTDPELFDAMVTASSHIMHREIFGNFIAALPAGFLIGLMAWSLPGLPYEKLGAVFIVTYLVGAGGFPHIVAGTVEATVLIVAGSWGVGDAISFIIPF